MFTALIGNMNQGEQDHKMSQTKVSCNRPVYTENQTISILRVRKSHLSKEYNRKDNWHVAQPCFSLDAYD